MAFTCDNEIEIDGGDAAERRAAANLVLASESVDEDSARRVESGGSLILRATSVDGLPEEELASLAIQFPGLSLTLVYFSKDGEFYGYAKAGPEESAAESDDFDEDTLDLVGRRHDGDGIAFARSRYSLGRASG
jgi:hypothetical protein